MKIILKPETDEEKEQMQENLVLSNVFEFALTGRNMKEELFESSFSHLHIADKYILLGKLSELTHRLRDAESSK